MSSRQYLSDEQLRSTVLREIEWDPAVTSKNISVKGQRRSGHSHRLCAQFSEKYAAERAAKSVYGVASLANDIEVKPASARTDPEIVRDVLQALTIHTFIPEDRIKVTVCDGFVTLEGTLE